MCIIILATFTLFVHDLLTSIFLGLFIPWFSRNSEAKVSNLPTKLKETISSVHYYMHNDMNIYEYMFESYAFSSIVIV